MMAEGGCYCGDVRYRVDGEPIIKALCFCRICQKVSGGSPPTILGVPEVAFAYTGEAPVTFAHPDVEAPTERDFCAKCGTQVTSRTPRGPGMVMIKVGTLDDPAVFGMPQMAVYVSASHAFHTVPAGVKTFETTPGAA